jgi:cell division protein FtsZ
MDDHPINDDNTPDARGRDAQIVGMADEYNAFDQRAVLKVCGIGGGGGNAVGRMIEAGLTDVEFITVNTDAQALRHSSAGTRLQIGAERTEGLGAGAKPEVGLSAANEDRERIGQVLEGADMVFLTAGLGGGTGTGASPVVAEVAREIGALTVAIVTMPFEFEGKERMENAIMGLGELEQHVDTLIVVPNERLAELCRSNISFLNAFSLADEVLHNGVRSISELITMPGLINLDFADVSTIMQSRGRALMGIGSAEGEQRAQRAAQEAIVCPLLEQSSIEGAKGVIVNIKGGCDIGMREVQEAVSTVQQAAHPDANIIFGAVVDDEQRPELQVTVIAAGFTNVMASGVDVRSRLSVVEDVAADSDPDLPGYVEEEPLEETAEPVHASEPSDADDGQMEYLFTEPEQPLPGVTQADFRPAPEEEDMGIPAFMRKRKRAK